MDPCNRCLVVAACQSNCENRINYVRGRLKLIDTTVVSVGFALILVMLISIGMSVYIGMTANVHMIRITWFLREEAWKMSVMWILAAMIFFILFKIPVIRYRERLKDLIGDV